MDSNGPDRLVYFRKFARRESLPSLGTARKRDAREGRGLGNTTRTRPTMTRAIRSDRDGVGEGRGDVRGSGHLRRREMDSEYPIEEKIVTVSPRAVSKSRNRIRANFHVSLIIVARVPRSRSLYIE